MQDVPPESTAQARAKRILSATPLFERLSKPSWNTAAAAVPEWVQRNRARDRCRLERVRAGIILAPRS